MNHLDEFTLNEYLDHVLDDSARSATNAHLQTCAACRAKLKELQGLFANLDDLPEARLERDLAPAILARLPKKDSVYTLTWTRTFAAQLGVVAGTLIWLGGQVSMFVNVPQLALPKLPAPDIQTLFMRPLSAQFPIPEFRFPLFHYQMPTFNFQLPTFTMQLSTNHITILAIATLLLWVVGNVILLRNRQRASS